MIANLESVIISSMGRKEIIEAKYCQVCGQATKHSKIEKTVDFGSTFVVDVLILLLTCGTAFVILLPIRIIQGIMIGVSNAKAQFFCAICGVAFSEKRIEDQMISEEEIKT